MDDGIEVVGWRGMEVKEDGARAGEGLRLLDLGPMSSIFAGDGEMD